jgi:hypothetical protein
VTSRLTKVSLDVFESIVRVNRGVYDTHRTPHELVNYINHDIFHKPSESAETVTVVIGPISVANTIYNPPFDSPTLSSSKKKGHHQNSSTSLTRKLARINSYLKEASFIDYRNELGTRYMQVMLLKYFQYGH